MHAGETFLSHLQGCRECRYRAIEACKGGDIKSILRLSRARIRDDKIRKERELEERKKQMEANNTALDALAATTLNYHR